MSNIKISKYQTGIKCHYYINSMEISVHETKIRWLVLAYWRNWYKISTNHTEQATFVRTLNRRALDPGNVPGGSHAKHSMRRAFRRVRQITPCFFVGDFNLPSTASTADSIKLRATLSRLGALGAPERGERGGGGRRKGTKRSKDRKAKTFGQSHPAYFYCR